MFTTKPQIQNKQSVGGCFRSTMPGPPLQLFGMLNQPTNVILRSSSSGEAPAKSYFSNFLLTFKSYFQEYQPRFNFSSSFTCLATCKSY